jgi:hypothetical protein
MVRLCSNKSAKSEAYSLSPLRWRPWALGRKIMLLPFHLIFVSITRGFPMKAWIPLTLVSAFGLAAHAQATCSYPASPAAPPDGKSATKEQMVAAAQDFKRYNGEMNMYLDCIKLEMDAPAPADPSKLTADEKKKADQQHKMYVKKNDAAVDELQAVVGRFNEQLKIYKARQTP